MLTKDRGDYDPFNLHTSEVVEVTHGEMIARCEVWDEAVKAHPNELVMTYEHDPEHSAWDMHIGIIDISSAAFNRVSSSMVVSANERGLLMSYETPIRIKADLVLKSFQTTEITIVQEELIVPQFELLAGDIAVAKWFSEPRNAHRVHQYLEICQKLDVDPVITPEIRASW